MKTEEAQKPAARQEQWGRYEFIKDPLFRKQIADLLEIVDAIINKVNPPPYQHNAVKHYRFEIKIGSTTYTMIQTGENREKVELSIRIQENIGRRPDSSVVMAHNTWRLEMTKGENQESTARIIKNNGDRDTSNFWIDETEANVIQPATHHLQKWLNTRQSGNWLLLQIRSFHDHLMGKLQNY